MATDYSQLIELRDKLEALSKGKKQQIFVMNVLRNWQQEFCLRR